MVDPCSRPSNADTRASFCLGLYEVSVPAFSRPVLYDASLICKIMLFEVGHEKAPPAEGLCAQDLLALVGFRFFAAGFAAFFRADGFTLTLARGFRDARERDGFFAFFSRDAHAS